MYMHCKQHKVHNSHSQFDFSQLTKSSYTTNCFKCPSPLFLPPPPPGDGIVLIFTPVWCRAFAGVRVQLWRLSGFSVAWRVPAGLRHLRPSRGGIHLCRVLLSQVLRSARWNSPQSDRTVRRSGPSPSKQGPVLHSCKNAFFSS